MKLDYKGAVVGAEPWPDAPFNKGRLCSKGVTAYKQLADQTRLRKPLIRRNGRLTEASWSEALSHVAGKIREIVEQHGPDAIGFYGSARRKTEAIYLFCKLAATGVRTPNIDTTLSQCHPGAVAAYSLAFGSPRSPNPYEDAAEASFLLIVGANPAESHPVLMNSILKAKSKGAVLVVVDPEKTQTARFADVHVKVKPGTDAVFLHGILNACISLSLVNERFMAEGTRGFDELRKSLSGFTPEYASQVTQVPLQLILDVARMYALAEASIILHGTGLEHQPNPVEANLAVTNLALSTGHLGALGRGCIPLVGQPNALGTTQVTAALGILPLPYLSSEQARVRMSKVWGFPLEMLPVFPGLTGGRIIDACRRGELKALYVYGSDPIVSMSDVTHVREALERLKLLVVHDSFATETSRIAHVVLPGSCWVEEDGTVTSGEGRTVRIGKLTNPIGDAKEDWRIFLELADTLGAGRYFNYAKVEDVFEEFKQLTRDTPLDSNGVTYERLRRETSSFIPCPSQKDAGTMRLYEQRFASENGLGVFHPVQQTGDNITSSNRNQDMNTTRFR